MIILPAIDLKDGECVRLFQGDYNTAHKVADNYMDTALRFKKAGAEWVHIVDLDGAKDAVRKNRKIILEIARNVKVKVQTGGGIRKLDDISDYLENGINRVIIGSAAVKNTELVKEAVRLYGNKIAVGIDVRNGYVATEGWIENSNVKYMDLAMQMCEMGVKYFVLTDISRDGMLNNPAHKRTNTLNKKVKPYGAKVIASGGIKSIRNLKTLHNNGIYGAICGKAIYSGEFNLEEAIAACKE